MKHSTYEERDFVRVVEDLEADQQHDLAVHLYLLFLLHRVNPYFPNERWSSWPLPLERAVDPREQSQYEDNMVDNLFRDFQDGVSWALNTSSREYPDLDEASEQARITFQRSDAGVSVRHKRICGSNPKATIVNEMHAAVQKAILHKAERLAKPGQKVVVDDTKLTRLMALQLANKLDKVFSTLETQNRRRGYYLKTWQDVLLASVRASGFGEVCDVDSHKKAYKRAERLFMHPHYNYEYDQEEAESVPAFDVAHHLATIEKQSNVKYPKLRPPLEYLEALKKEAAMKDHVFWMLLRQASSARLLSWRESDILRDYEVGDCEFPEETAAVFTDRGTALRPSQFEVDDGYS